MAAEILDTALGPVELARAGEGPAVLFVHGTPGGSDSSLAMGKFLVDAGFEVVAPSRPGYLGTPLGALGEIDAQADLHAATLDALGLERAAVMAWSGGGPSSYRLASRHRERISALVPFAAVSGKYAAPPEDLETRLMLKTSIGNWMLRFMAAHLQKDTVKATLQAEGDLDKQQLKELVGETLADPDQSDVVLTMANVVGDYEHRKVGVDNDLARFAEIDSLQLESIDVPTLVINGTADSDVPPAHSDFAAHTIADAERLEMTAGTHLCLFAHADAKSAQARVVEFLRASA